MRNPAQESNQSTTFYFQCAYSNTTRQSVCVSVCVSLSILEKKYIPYYSKLGESLCFDSCHCFAPRVLQRLQIPVRCRVVDNRVSVCLCVCVCVCVCVCGNRIATVWMSQIRRSVCIFVTALLDDICVRETLVCVCARVRVSSMHTLRHAMCDAVSRGCKSKEGRRSLIESYL